MNKRKWRSVFAVMMMLTLVPTVAQATLVTGLYSAEVTVKGQGSVQRSQGFRQALKKVIGKISGDQRLAASKGLRGLIKKAPRLVQQYHYRPLSNVEKALKKNARKSHALVVQFVADRLNQELTTLQIPLWDADRPQTLVWIALEYNRERQILSNNSRMGKFEVSDLLRKRALDRGLPVLLPLMDMEDQQALSYSDLRGGFADRIQAASQRYRTYAILSASVRQNRSGSWSGEWLLDVAGESKTWRSVGSLASVFAQGFDGLAEELSARFATSQNVEVQTLKLEVRGVQGLQDYVRLNRYLNGLAMVESADISRLTPDFNQYLLRVKGDIGDLQRSISLGRLLSPHQESGLVVEEALKMDLRYQLLP
ncbi:MAG: DUF2066 domain-containing protein [Gammaproteobacteria bacterium]|nr:DUF2066 domain-containing protein [Gammaproteobacteria bacterium]